MTRSLAAVLTVALLLIFPGAAIAQESLHELQEAMLVSGGRASALAQEINAFAIERASDAQRDVALAFAGQSEAMHSLYITWIMEILAEVPAGDPSLMEVVYAAFNYGIGRTRLNVSNIETFLDYVEQDQLFLPREVMTNVDELVRELQLQIELFERAREVIRVRFVQGR